MWHDAPHVCQYEEELDLNDPDLQDAATKIQSGFRGFQVERAWRPLCQCPHMRSAWDVFTDKLLPAGAPGSWG